MFYAQPRFVKHIDEYDAIGALTKYYAEVFPAVPKDGDDKVALLDVCSSWISHYPAGVRGVGQPARLRAGHERG